MERTEALKAVAYKLAGQLEDYEQSREDGTPASLVSIAEMVLGMVFYRTQPKLADELIEALGDDLILVMILDQILATVRDLVAELEDS